MTDPEPLHVGPDREPPLANHGDRETGDRGRPSKPEPSVVLLAEQLVTSTERVVSGRVRLRRRIVSETRTIDVVVRREELIIETHDIASGAVGESYRGTASDTPSVSEPTTLPAGPLVVLLREEIPEVVLRRRAYERVTAAVVAVAEVAVQQSTVRHEESTVSTTPGE